MQNKNMVWAIICKGRELESVHESEAEARQELAELYDWSIEHSVMLVDEDNF